MSPIWFTPFILVAGALQGFGAVMSAQLRVSLTNPWLALAVLFTLNAFFFAGLFSNGFMFFEVDAKDGQALGRSA